MFPDAVPKNRNRNDWLSGVDVLDGLIDLLGLLFEGLAGLF